MAENRTDVLDLLRKQAPDADLDFLREGPQMLIQAVTEVDASAPTRDGQVGMQGKLGW